MQHSLYRAQPCGMKMRILIIPYCTIFTVLLVFSLNISSRCLVIAVSFGQSPVLRHLQSKNVLNPTHLNRKEFKKRIVVLVLLLKTLKDWMTLWLESIKTPFKNLFSSYMQLLDDRSVDLKERTLYIKSKIQ